MSLRVATGLPFLGEHKTKQGNVLLIVAEGQAGARKRIQRWFEYHDLPYATNVGILPHIFDLIKKEEIQELLTLIDGFQRPNLIAIDPLTNMLESENDEVQMGTLVKVAGLLRAHYHCTVAMVHHTGWKEDREIGSSKLRRGADTMISIRKPGGYEAPILDGLIMQCKKQKDFEPFHAFGVHCRKVGYGDESSIVLTDKYNVMDEKDIEREMKAEIKLYDVLQYLPTDPEQAITRQDLVTLAGLGHMAVRSIIKDSLFVVETGKGLKNLPYRYYLSPKGVAFVDRQRGIRLANNGVS
jgi:hypothetical protein